MKRLLFCVLVSFSAVTVPGAIGHAQTPAEEGIHAMGEVVLEKPPEWMRLHVNVLATGKDLSVAMEKLKVRRAEVEKQLETLGALPDSVRFGDIVLDLSQDNRQLQMEMAMRQRMAQNRGQKRTAESEATAKPVNVMSSLTADWPLPAGEASERLLAAVKLRQVIRAGELGVKKKPDESTPEEAELAEEMDGLAPGYDDGEGPGPGEPTFVFVARFSDADRQQALTDAFRAAKQEATELAQAAELELGALRSLRRSSRNDAGGGDDYRSNYNSRYEYGERPFPFDQDRPGEIIGMSPEPLKYRVLVNATFATK